jgi:hypothetical protein
MKIFSKMYYYFVLQYHKLSTFSTKFSHSYYSFFYPYYCYWLPILTMNIYFWVIIIWNSLCWMLCLCYYFLFISCCSCSWCSLLHCSSLIDFISIVIVILCFIGFGIIWVIFYWCYFICCFFYMLGREESTYYFRNVLT